jgi:hypothetical protein
MFALFVEIKDAHTHQTIIMNVQIQMMWGKLVVCTVAMTANGLQIAEGGALYH